MRYVTIPKPITVVLPSEKGLTPQPVTFAAIVEGIFLDQDMLRIYTVPERRKIKRAFRDGEKPGSVVELEDHLWERGLPIWRQPKNLLPAVIDADQPENETDDYGPMLGAYVNAPSNDPRKPKPEKKK